MNYMENFENEIWKDIPEYEKLYQASNLGRIRSLDHYVNIFNGIKKRSGRILKQVLRRKDSYYFVQLCKNNIKKSLSVHRLVWSAFNGSIPNGIQINHINEIKTDNRLINLNLMDSKTNCNWGTRNERIAKSQINKNNSKQVLQFDLNGSFITEWPSTMEIERITGLNNTNIGCCCRGKYKQAYGYIWKYKKDCHN